MLSGLIYILFATLGTAISGVGFTGYQIENQDSTAYNAVTVTAEAIGFNGWIPITVEVTATENRIYDVTVIEHDETDGVGSVAIDQLPGEMVSQNRVDVDGVAGATITSTALKHAVSDALNQAGFDISKFGGELDTEDMIIEESVRTARATAEGFIGDIVVEVVADADRIYSVVVLEHTETPEVGGYAIEEMISMIVESNTTRVDAISGATETSGAVIEAVDKALIELGLDPYTF